MNSLAEIKTEGAPSIGTDVDEEPSHQLRVLDIKALLEMDMPEREYVLRPLLPCRGLGMLYAPRGIGKTFLALTAAYAVAAGGEALRWKADKPRKVLYVDGEMPLESLQERLAAVIEASKHKAPFENFKLLAADYQEFGIPDLSTREGQQRIEPFLEGVELLVIDNLSTLVRSGKENEAESWTAIQEWLLGLRRRGIAALLIHHAGKDGKQRGTSKREDVLDTVICLRRPSNYEEKQGARFEIHLEKARGVFGDDASPFEATLLLETTAEAAMAVWKCQDLADVKLQQVVDLTGDGLTVREIATEMGIPKSTVQRMQAKARAEGLIHD